MGKTIDQLITEDIAEDIKNRIIAEIEKDDLVFSGALKNSWKVVQDENGQHFVVSDLIYAKIMDEGRLPGKMPPVNKLMPWVFQKLGAKDEKELKQKAFAVAKSIAEKGIEPRHYIRRALFQMEAESS